MIDPKKELSDRYGAICDWIHHAENGHCTHTEAVDAIEALARAARGFVEAA